MITARWLGSTRHDLASCGSTNDEAERLAREGAAHGTVVTAARQTSGRGRADHQWFSPEADNLYLSCVLRPELEPAAVPPITLAAGIGVCDTVNSWGAHASLRWPNDVFVMGRKIAGILTEMSSRGSKVEYVVLGVGVNVNMSSTDLPPDIADTAISLRTALAGRRVDRARFTEVLLLHLERWLDRFFQGGIAAISGPWLERAQLAGRRIRTDSATGIARGLDRDGALLVEDDRGKVHRVVAGDVVLG